MKLFNYKKVGGQKLTSNVNLDDTIVSLSASADYKFNGKTEFIVPEFEVPPEYTLGVIYGPSGTGKSSILRDFGETLNTSWNRDLAIASQVDPSLLMRLGLSSIPSLCRPYHVLSTGEKHRADLAKVLNNGCVIDEFTSVCNRELAKSISLGLRQVIDHCGYKRVVIATCHEDVLSWLQPNWVINTSTGRVEEGRLERQLSTYKIIPCTTKAWSVFASHHYLSSKINKSARCWMLITDKDYLCGFSSAIPFPRRGLKNAWREHRTVILPDFQGIGLGSRLSDEIAKRFYDGGYRYFSKTAHPKLGEHRNKSKLWKPTSMNQVSRKSSYTGIAKRREDDLYDKRVTKGAYASFDYLAHANRLCYSHEYIGDGTRILKDNIRKKESRDLVLI